MLFKTLCLLLCLALFDIQVNGFKHYVAYKRKIKFFSAWQQCRLYNGHLASIETPEENAQVARAIKAVGDITDDWYIGGTDIGFEGRFVWIGLNKIASYLNFNPGEPNNNKNEDCLIMKGSKAGEKWSDVSCEYEAEGFVCAFIL
ncbi:mannose-binding protein [Anopheles gambiae]|uniref:C-type lectin domain-containing protein n=2 Tax=Anopheles gambiae TaxID=7165 RepID=A0A1S4H4Q4_ANOGA|nr:mannose-binding protein [Anopheles gambiae]